MEMVKPPDAYNTSENNRQENRGMNHMGVRTSIFSITQEFKPHGFPSKMVKILDSTTVLIAMIIVTFYTLFSDDIRISSFPMSTDSVFFGLSSCALAFFGIEMILCFIFKPEYRWSFYFWLDLIATISIIPDIGWIWDTIVGLKSASGNQIANAGQSSRAGTRSTRAIRVVRLVRLMRIAKLYKHAKRAVKSNSVDNVYDNDEMSVPRESRVGKKLSDIITKRVIILVMVILILNPLFDLAFYITPLTSWDYGITAIHDYSAVGNSTDLVEFYQNVYIQDSRPLIYLNFSSGYHWSSTQTSVFNLRSIEMYYSQTIDSIAIFDIREDTQLDAKLSMCKTIFVCIVLVTAAVIFVKDVNDFAIIPIEKMIIKVKAIAANPMKIAEEKFKDIYDFIEEESKTRWNRCCKPKAAPSTEYETAVLENTIVKIGVLLALGFGEAGATIISSNVKSGGDLDPLVKGNKIAAIFGFCDIRNFTDATEELQEGVMVFVNEMARIVHSTVDHYCGAANKNIGDAFLLVWKFRSEEVESFSDPVVFKEGSIQQKYLGDLALASFLKVMVKINKDPSVLKYRSNAKLVKRMPGYQVKLGLGLHLGWAIEGGIGSHFKIDASYLSHHVNMASNLEALTKNYGIPLLLTDRLYDVLSAVGKKFCRHIDTISLKGGRDVYRLYTSDVDFSGVLPGKPKDNSKERMRNKRNPLKFRLESGAVESWEILEESKEIELIKKSFTEEFFTTYEFGMDKYVSGNWKEAKELFSKAMKLRYEDGPSKALINFMQESNFKAPSDWAGIRKLY